MVTQDGNAGAPASLARQDAPASDEVEAKLRELVRVVGRLIGEVIVEQEGAAVFEQIERLRQGFIALRDAPDPAPPAALAALIAGLTPEAASSVLRGFIVYFALVNIAEEVMRARAQAARLDAAWPRSFAAVLGELTARGLGYRDFADRLPRLLFLPVITAHPTEARRRAILSDRFELYPTRSEAAVREFGLVFRDSSGVLWNQVDSPLAPATIATVKERFGAVDPLFAMYASQNFDYFDGAAAGLPYETHRHNRASALAIGPRAVAPAAAGFRFCGAHAWLNAFVFPIDRLRFVADLKQLGLHRRGLSHEPRRRIRDRGRPGRTPPWRVFGRGHGQGRQRRDRVRSDRAGAAARRPQPRRRVGRSAAPNPRSLPRRLDRLCPGKRHANPNVPPPRRLLCTFDRVPGRGLGLHPFQLPCRWHAGDARCRGGRRGPSHRRLGARRVDRAPQEPVLRARVLAPPPNGLRRGGRAGGRRRAAAPLPDLLTHYVLNVAPGSERAAKTPVDRQLAALGKA